MATVTGPHAEGAYLNEDDAGRESYAAVYTVKDVAGTGQQLLRNALAAPGIPRRGQRHPNHPSAHVAGRRATGGGGRTLTVTITYDDKGESDDPSDQHISIGTSLRTVQTNKDVNGHVVRLSCPGKKDQGGEMSVERPLSTIHVTRTEEGSPGAKSQEYVGTVNKLNQFRLAEGGANEWTWRCEYITGDSSDGGRTWRVEYEFQYDKHGWEQEVVFIDPETGRVAQELLDAFGSDPFGSIATEGWKFVQVYEEKNFNQLQLG